MQDWSSVILELANKSCTHKKNDKYTKLTDRALPNKYHMHSGYYYVRYFYKAKYRNLNLERNTELSYMRYIHRKLASTYCQDSSFLVINKMTNT